MFKVAEGDRVQIPSLNLPGVIEHIDYPLMFNDLAYPIQVLLDSPYDSSGHMTFRTNLKDLKPTEEGLHVIVYSRKRRRIFMAWS